LKSSGLHDGLIFDVEMRIHNNPAFVHYRPSPGIGFQRIGRSFPFFALPQPDHPTTMRFKGDCGARQIPVRLPRRVKSHTFDPDQRRMPPF
jgi:hypothetical protein